MNFDDKLILGIDIGGTKVALCLADPMGNILDSIRVDSGTQTDYSRVLREMLATADRLIERNGGRERIAAVGIGAPGPMDVRAGVLEKSPNMVWEDVPVRDDVANHLDLPVSLDNDANGGILAEWFFGSAKGRSSAIYLTMSTGIGGGVIVEDHLLHGRDCLGGELGHIVLDVDGPVCGCGQRGCFEAFCGGANMSRRMQDILADQPDHPIMSLADVRGDYSKLNYQVLRAAVCEGIPLARELWEDVCLRTAQGIGALMMVFNPEVVILGTLAYYSGDMLLDPVKKHLPKFAWKQMRQGCEITLPGLGPKIGELAGVSIALYSLRKKRLTPASSGPDSPMP